MNTHLKHPRWTQWILLCLVGVGIGPMGRFSAKQAHDLRNFEPGLHAQFDQAAEQPKREDIELWVRR